MTKVISKNEKGNRIGKILSDEKRITETLRNAISKAVETHIRDGNPLAAWKDGKAVWVDR